MKDFNIHSCRRQLRAGGGQRSKLIMARPIMSAHIHSPSCLLSVARRGCCGQGCDLTAAADPCPSSARTQSHLYIPHHGASNEAIFDGHLRGRSSTRVGAAWVLAASRAMACSPQLTHHVWVLGLVHHLDICELDAEVLVHRVQNAADGEVVLQLHHHLRALQAANAYASTLDHCWLPVERGARRG